MNGFTRQTVEAFTHGATKKTISTSGYLNIKFVERQCEKQRNCCRIATTQSTQATIILTIIILNEPTSTLFSTVRSLKLPDIVELHLRLFMRDWHKHKLPNTFPTCIITLGQKESTGNSTEKYGANNMKDREAIITDYYP